jgi:hypothetical protein
MWRSGDAVPTLSLDCSATSVTGHRNRARVDGQANKDFCGEACRVKVRYYELVSVATAPFEKRAIQTSYIYLFTVGVSRCAPTRPLNNSKIVLQKEF